MNLAKMRLTDAGAGAPVSWPVRAAVAGVLILALARLYPGSPIREQAERTSPAMTRFRRHPSRSRATVSSTSAIATRHWGSSRHASPCGEAWTRSAAISESRAARETRSPVLRVHWRTGSRQETG